MRTKRIAGAILALAGSLSLFLAGCGGQESAKSGGGEEKQALKNITVTTSFLYDMTKELLPEGKARVELIIPAGEDPHLYVPRPEDLQKLKSAELVLYHGLHFEGKMVDALEQMGTAVTEDFPEERLGKMDEDGRVIVDPHFWFDLELYGLAVEKAGEALQELLPEEAEAISQNTAAYKEKLKELDSYARAEIAKIPAESRYLITPHDAFNYFSRSYDMPVHAPQGVSTDTEVAVADISETVDFILEHKVKAIFAESTTDPARMLKIQEDCRNKGFEVTVVSGEGEELFSDSLAPEGQPGDNFVDMFKHNVDLIVRYLQ